VEQIKVLHSGCHIRIRGTDGRAEASQDLRKKFNRYSKSFGENSIESFKLGTNPGKQFFRPVSETLSEQQKKFLQAACKDKLDLIF